MQCDQKIMNRLKRAEGQMRGIQKMMSEGQSCGDMMVQLAAVRASVDKIMGVMAAENLKHQLENPDADPDRQAEQLAKAMRLIEKK
ncbi:metal-sensing transcriptional repressor [Vagococcus coleopterorum]|uniref:Metal-sensing transcriptional repressor n=1 Tax=Vagococcus coleopterorum TaxID=2714946 RepID=A0A6G8AMF7_9ENTE|nr:metal-sensing transcriptional repressor [Vagococcus coleopterorum]QIL46115.1 metal-sensing transcriptional repressor [Vagococcus coleopterorum]